MEQAVADKQDAKARPQITTIALSGTAIVSNIALLNLLNVSPAISNIPQNLGSISSWAALAGLCSACLALSSEEIKKEEWNNTSRTTSYASILLSITSAFALVGDLSGQIHRSIRVPQEVSARYAKDPEFKSQIDSFIVDTFKQCSNGSSEIEGPLYECPLIEDAPQPL